MNNRQFIREIHNRQDKVIKPDYRSQMLPATEPPNSKNTWGLSGSLLHQINAVLNPSKRNRSKAARSALLESFTKRFERGTYLIRGYRFSFQWGIKGFARNNALTGPEAKSVFEVVSTEAAERRRMVMQRARNSELEETQECSHSGSGGTVTHYAIEIDVEQILPLANMPY